MPTEDLLCPIIKHDASPPTIPFTPEGGPKVPDAAAWLRRVARFLYLMDILPGQNSENNHLREPIDVERFWKDYQASRSLSRVVYNHRYRHNT